MPSHCLLLLLLLVVWISMWVRLWVKRMIWTQEQVSFSFSRRKINNWPALRSRNKSVYMLRIDRHICVRLAYNWRKESIKFQYPIYLTDSTCTAVWLKSLEFYSSCSAVQECFGPCKMHSIWHTVEDVLIQTTRSSQFYVNSTARKWKILGVNRMSRTTTDGEKLPNNRFQVIIKFSNFF